MNPESTQGNVPPQRVETPATEPAVNAAGVPDTPPITVICTDSGVFGQEHKDALDSVGIHPNSISREIGRKGDKVTITSDLFNGRTRDAVLELLLKTGKFRSREGV